MTNSNTLVSFLHMVTSRFTAASTGLMLALSMLFWLTVSQADAAQFDPEKIDWSELTFSASVLFYTAKAEVQFKAFSASDVVTDLITPNPMPASKLVMPANDKVYWLRSYTSNFGRNSALDFWFEPDLTALQRTQTETGRKNIVRTYRFLESGAYRFDTLPAAGEEKAPHSSWTQHSSQFYPYPENLPAHKMTDNNIIFYAMSAADWRKDGDRLVFLTFDKEHINQVEMVLQGTEALETDYVAHGPNGKKRVNETVNALRLAIKASPVDKNAAKSDFSFLGVKGDITVYIHPQTRLPLQVSGNADYIGHSDIVLTRAVFRK